MYERDLVALFETLIRAMVKETQCVSVLPELQPGQPALLRIIVHDSDLGKIVGRGGRIARSLRTILLAISRQSGSSYKLDISGGCFSHSDFAKTDVLPR